MEPSPSVEQVAKDLIKTLFRMCRESRQYQQDIADLAREIPLEYAATKRIIAGLEQQGYVETLTFGQRVALTDAGIVVAQRLIH